MLAIVVVVVVVVVVVLFAAVLVDLAVVVVAAEVVVVAQKVPPPLFSIFSSIHSLWAETLLYTPGKLPCTMIMLNMTVFRTGLGLCT